LLVVNAANADKDLAWLRAVNSRRYILDDDHPAVETEGEVTIRDLRDASSGTDRRLDLALQGPSSLAILQGLADDATVRRSLGRIRRTEHKHLKLAGIDLIVARTGYTGEEVGFELLVHPDRALALWELLLEKGAPFGITPCGLAARDSTRIEAGLPLYGHELAGEHNITPSEAGFSGYVKLHKPFFVGRRPSLENELNHTREIARFQVNEPGQRALRPGDPVVNKRGQYIGRVTSCTLVGGQQIGLALVEKRYNELDTEISVFPVPHGKKRTVKALEDLAGGDRIPLSIGATVLSRFPQDEEKALWSLSGE
jgi:glycine hydroxymethyltransferase